MVSLQTSDSKWERDAQMNFQIKTVTDMKDFPIDTTTVGYWAEEKNCVTFYLYQMSDWRYMVAVLFHEMIEWAVTKSKGVTTAECDAFDEMYEVQYEEGRNKADEPGDDKACPYYLGHQHGNRIERMVIFLLGASWKDYLKECGEICGCIYPISVD